MQSISTLLHFRGQGCCVAIISSPPTPILWPIAKNRSGQGLAVDPDFVMEMRPSALGTAHLADD